MNEFLKKYWPLIVAVLLLLSSSKPGRDLAAEAYAKSLWSWSLAENANAAPTIPVTPSGKCDSCNGRGVVGDGVTMKKCLKCNGTGVYPPKTDVTPDESGEPDAGSAGAIEEYSGSLPPSQPNEPEPRSMPPTIIPPPDVSVDKKPAGESDEDCEVDSGSQNDGGYYRRGLFRWRR